MHIKDLTTGKKELFFDAAKSKPSIPKSRPLEEQGPRESQKLWHTTTDAIKRADQKVATDEKSRIEDEQRKEAAERGENAWRPKIFTATPTGDEDNLDFIIPFDAVDTNAPAEKQIEQILAIAPILPGQQASPSQSRTTAAQPPADLIDFGQHDGAPLQPGSSQAGSSQADSSIPRGAVKRMDTDGDGGEDIFVDAES